MQSPVPPASTASGQPRLSVIVVSFDVAPLLRRCLAGLTEADEVVVVDNASSDDSVDVVRREFPHVTLIASVENRGFSRAVNQGAAVATGDLLLLLNPDTEVGPGVLSAMRDALVRRPAVAAVGFRQIDAHGIFQLSFGPRPWIVLEVLRMVVQRRLDTGDRRLAGLIDRLFSRPVRVPWVTGSSLLVRRDAFDAVGGFDEGFFLYFEDADFCLRLGRAVGPVLYDPRISILHHRGKSAAGQPGRVAQAYRDSRARYWRKHRGAMVAALVALIQRARDRGRRAPTA